MNLVKAIQFARPNEQWSLKGNEYSGLTWVSDTPKPSEEELKAAWESIKTDVLWEPVRDLRNSLLASSDWTQLPDVSAVDRRAWASYRKKLRDITSDFATPDQVVWPAKPE